MKSNIIIDQNITHIISLYESGMSLTKICEKLSINRKALARLLKNNNIVVRSGFSYARKYNLNEHYFDNIDSEEKAYILGFIYADGNNLFRTNRISIHLSKADEEILYKFGKLIYNGEFSLKYHTKVNNKGKRFEYVYMNMFSEHMSQHLATLGVIEAKSHKIVFPEWLDESLYRHFIRGLIDGDGWIYIPNNNRDSPNVGLICTRQVNDKLLTFFDKELGLSSYICRAHKQDIDVMCEIRIKNYHQCKILLDWLYKDSIIYLKRKYDIYLRFLKIYNELRDQNK
jgi:hypothetical protein